MTILPIRRYWLPTLISLALVIAGTWVGFEYVKSKDVTYQSIASYLSGLIGLEISVAGFALTVVGIWLTYRQATDAKTAAEASRTAVDTFRLRLERYNLSQELSVAVGALDSSRRHILSGAWRDASESHEVGRQALVRALAIDLENLENQTERMLSVADEMRAFANKVDAALAGKGRYPDEAKIIPVLRASHDYLLSLQKTLEREIQ